MRHAALALVSSVVACNGGSDGGAVTTTTQHQTTAQQAASVVATYRADILTAIENDENCETRASLLACLAAEARVNRLRAIVNRAAPLNTALKAGEPYVAEIDPLVQGTLAVLAVLTIQEVALTDCLNTYDGKIGPCEDRMSSFTEAIGDLKRRLMAWEPYI